MSTIIPAPVDPQHYANLIAAAKLGLQVMSPLQIAQVGQSMLALSMALEKATTVPDVPPASPAAPG